MADDIARLGRYVLARRKSMKLTQGEIADLGGPSTTTQSKIEMGEAGNVSRTTLQKLDKGLSWKEGSAARVLAGGKPEAIITWRALTEPDELRNSLGLDDHAIDWPAGTFDGLSDIEVDEVLTAARLAGLDRARAIRMSPNRGSALERVAREVQHSNRHLGVVPDRPDLPADFADRAAAYEDEEISEGARLQAEADENEGV